MNSKDIIATRTRRNEVWNLHKVEFPTSLGSANVERCYIGNDKY